MSDETTAVGLIDEVYYADNLIADPSVTLDYQTQIDELQTQVAALKSLLNAAEIERDYFRVQWRAAQNEVMSVKSQLTQRGRSQRG